MFITKKRYDNDLAAQAATYMARITNIQMHAGEMQAENERLFGELCEANRRADDAQAKVSRMTGGLRQNRAKAA
ncbi:hypothetical protein PX699_13530 [Sphingobium sp. H39-3-25]|uniref:hypothetical protein n=1 Tax=Sphingobium arseniciresistens TaxID=3030834 RepID=UPI0023BA03A9|nr:hypothetical protein [Sphingobium arseniciresistens]